MLRAPSVRHALAAGIEPRFDHVQPHAARVIPLLGPLPLFDGRLLQAVADGRLEGAVEFPDHLVGVLAAEVFDE
jgi:hypothetical protein